MFALANVMWQTAIMSTQEPTLGRRLKTARSEKGLSLRDVERVSGVNSGYLSQLERDEIASPGPSTLQKLATAYGEPFSVLMMWAGYIEADDAALAPNAKRALSVLGSDFTDDELSVMKAVLDTLRKKAGFAASRHRTDHPLSGEDQTAIRKHAVALLREIDALKQDGSVDLDAAYATAKLVQVGAIELTLEERRSLRQRFGDLADAAVKRILGVLHTDSGQVYVNADLHSLKKRFVLGHEAGHAVLPDHQLVFAHLDDKHRLSPEFNDLLERQANQFAAEILAKGDKLRQEFDDSPARAHVIGELSDRYQMSCQAIARRVGEESQREVAVALAFRAFDGQGELMPPKVYCSPAFERRMRWRSGRLPRDDVRKATMLAGAKSPVPSMLTSDANGAAVELAVDGMDARYAAIVIFSCQPQAPTRRLAPFLRRL
jgi:transcriptional regulator with XRE-family HTH domain